MKERTSIKPVYAETFSINFGMTHNLLDEHIDKLMNLVLDYDAHCEKLEQDIEERPNEQLSICNAIQNKLNIKV